jgi:hypothetical protein
MNERLKLARMLGRIAEEIRPTEVRLDLRGEKDARPRIDGFQDAVRAFETGHDMKRLTLELLSYDVQMLRYLCAHPLAPALTIKNSPPSAELQRYRDAYRHYAVLFAALFAETADAEHQDRMQTEEEAQAILTALEEAALKATRQGEAMVDVEALARQYGLDDPRLTPLLARLRRAALTGSKMTAQTLAECKAMKKTLAREAERDELAHRAYALAQLALYENAPDVVKKLASPGVNLMGSHIEDAVQSERDERGR